MQKNMKKMLSKACVLSLALSMLAPAAFDADSAEAKAKPKLAKKSVSVIKGKTARLTIKGKKIKKTKWSVNKKKIVKLSKKKKKQVTVKGLKAGKATVTAKVKAGKKTYKLKAKVTVKDSTATQTPTKAPNNTPGTSATPDNSPSITLDKTELTLDYLKTAVLTATVKNSKDTVTWSTSNDKAVTVDSNGKIKAVEEGTAVITAAITGKSATCKVTVNKVPLETVILSENFDDGTSKYYTKRVTSTDPNVDVVDGGRSGKCFRVYDRTSTAQGALLDLTDICEPGSTYEFTAYAKLGSDAMDTASLLLSTETQAVEGSGETYANLLAVTSASKNYEGAAKVTQADPKEWHEFTYTITAPDDMYHYGLYFETQKDTSCEIFVDDVTVKLVGRNTPDYSIKALKDVYSPYFNHIGVGAGYDQFIGENASDFIKSQFNSVTMGNEMKPDAILGSSFTQMTVEEAAAAGYYIPEGYADNAENVKSGKIVVPALDFSKVDKVIEQAYKTGEQMRFHVLVWHEQTPVYFFKQKYMSATSSANASQEAMNLRLDYYIHNVMDHVLAKEKELTGGNGTIFYSFDVVNEYFHSHNASTKNTNGLTFWEEIYGKDADGKYLYDKEGHMSTTPSYVKLAFKLAQEGLVRNNRTDISLIYNDYNTYDPTTTENIVDMVKWINTKDDINTEGGQLCDGVGMQAHLAVGQDYHSPARFKTAVEAFLGAGLNVQITELDITRASSVTDEEQADNYKEIMSILLDANKNRGETDGKVTDVTFWSLYDATSWRASQYPCVFKGLYNPKPAFYSVVEAAEDAGQ